MQFVTELSLNTSVQYVVEVVATNNVGLSVSAVSLPFVVDDTPPECVLSPQFDVASFSLRPGTQFDRSVLSMSWLFRDEESPVWTHSVSLLTHHDGHVPVSRVLLGDVTRATLSLQANQQLQDGNRYVARLDACNAAGLCTTAHSPDILIDSSPPEIGGFVEPLTWQNVDAQKSVIMLSWSGFDDAHSGIALYHVQIGSSYSGSELSGGVISVPHNDSATVQNVAAELAANIVPYSMLYVSIWAENGAGLVSDTAKVGLLALKTGSEHGRLEIEKHSCDFHYCNRDCTCAVLHRPCAAGDQIPDCLEPLPVPDVLRVIDGSPGHAVTMTASSTCLRAFWTLTSPAHTISRYEWTVGLQGDEPGSPIFDLVRDKVWHDVDLQEQNVYCLPGNRSLSHGGRYVYYLRAWHSFSEWSVHESPGVLVDSTPPALTSRWVREMDSTFSHELDFTTDATVLYLDWASVFRDAESGVQHYIMSVGTTAGGNELVGPVNMGNATRTVLENLSLVAGLQYFTTIHAYNGLGMVTSMTSDGIVLDVEPPMPGVVFTAASFQDAAHGSGDMEVSWHGFEDLHSFIHHYEWAVAGPNQTAEELEFRECGLESAVRVQGLQEGAPYVAYVRAVDAASHASRVVASREFRVDRSAPEGYACTQPTAVLANVSVTCEGATCSVNESISLQAGQACLVTLHAQHPEPLTGARLQLARMFDWIHLAREAPGSFSHSSLYSAGAAAETVSPLIHQYAGGDASGLTMDVWLCSRTDHSSTPLSLRQTGPVGVRLQWAIRDSGSGLRGFRVGVGTSVGGFQLQPLTDVGLSFSASMAVAAQHGQSVYAVVVAEDGAGLTAAFSAGPLTIDWTPPLLTDLTVSFEETGSGPEWTVAAAWTATEEESELQDCHWQIGKSI